PKKEVVKLIIGVKYFFRIAKIPKKGKRKKIIIR
ncbi:MAG: hypothetical protein ACJAUH_003282, partial [Saprospiraceae bacterium]